MASLREASRKNLFKGVKTGDGDVSISLLQFAKSTLFFGKLSIRNIFALKTILRSFELVAA